MNILRKDNVLYPEPSYLIVGALLEVNDALGFGHKEKYYEEALAKFLIRKIYIINVNCIIH